MTEQGQQRMAEARAALNKFYEAADGPSADAEHKAAIELADLLQAWLDDATNAAEGNPQ